MSSPRQRTIWQHKHETTSAARGARIVLLLLQYPLTADELAGRLNASRQGVHRLLAGLGSAGIPLYMDENGRWHLLSGEEESPSTPR